MKDIKSYVIGFLTCACLLLIMGQTIGNEQIEQMKNMTNQMKNAGLMPDPVGRYQISTIFTGAYPLHTIMDTKSGEIIAKIRDHTKNYEKIEN